MCRGGGGGGGADVGETVCLCSFLCLTCVKLACYTKYIYLKFVLWY